MSSFAICNSSANDICKESKRQTINAEDVFKALEDIEFSEFIEPLKAALEGQFLFTAPKFFDCSVFFLMKLNAFHRRLHGPFIHRCLQSLVNFAIRFLDCCVYLVLLY